MAMPLLASLLASLLIDLTVAATPTNNLNTLTTRYGCGYGTKDQQIQCVLGSLKFVCWQEALVARVAYGLPDTDPAIQSFISCGGGSAADPFNSDQSSWATAEVYYERGRDSLAARVSGGTLSAKGKIYRAEPGAAAALMVKPNVGSIQSACADAAELQNDQEQRLATDPGFPAYEAQWLRGFQVSKTGYGKCKTIVSNGWASAVGVPIVVYEAALARMSNECAVRPAQCPELPTN